MSQLASRVSRLIAGSVHAAVDALENAAPDMVMEQAIREVEKAIEDVRAELGQVIAERHLAQKQLAQNSDRHEELSSQIEAAIAKDRDDLAQAAIARQMDLEAQTPVLEQTIAAAAEKEKELEGYIAALRGKRAEMREEMRLYRERQRERPENGIIDASGKPSSAHDINRAVERASAAFERASGTLAIGDAALSDAAQLAELKELSRQNEIEKRLAAMKAKTA